MRVIYVHLRPWKSIKDLHLKFGYYTFDTPNFKICKDAIIIYKLYIFMYMLYSINMSFVFEVVYLVEVLSKQTVQPWYSHLYWPHLIRNVRNLQQYHQQLRIHTNYTQIEIKKW